ncbi:zinc finger protein 706 isoform X1 [Dermochelys coriacea]|uniref:zinc finger protein 706 isoform X1 n=1 Tax=Dermochelys coriacea TaxID=27794 RepID=UPI001CA99424|nr:zinc finger protein 706 isoform X1 [Dermochelys coriacea]
MGGTGRGGRPRLLLRAGGCSIRAPGEVLRRRPPVPVEAPLPSLRYVRGRRRHWPAGSGRPAARVRSGGGGGADSSILLSGRRRPRLLRGRTEPSPLARSLAPGPAGQSGHKCRTPRPSNSTLRASILRLHFLQNWLMFRHKVVYR